MSFHRELSKHKQLRNLFILTIMAMYGIAIYSGSIRIWLAAFFIINCCSWFYIYIDKKKAVAQAAFRLPERTFLILSLLGGGLGTILAMYRYHHKTKHYPLLISIICLFLVHILIVFYFLINNK